MQKNAKILNSEELNNYFYHKPLLHGYKLNQHVIIALKSTYYPILVDSSTLNYRKSNVPNLCCFQQSTETKKAKMTIYIYIYI